MQQIPILHVCDSDKRKLKNILADKHLSQVYSTYKGESESVVVDESSTEDREPESVHKIINTNKEKYAIYESEHEKTLVTENPVINGTSYFNLFECGKNILNSLGATSEKVCMANSRDRYYTEMYKTINYYNDHNNTPL